VSPVRGDNLSVLCGVRRREHTIRQRVGDNLGATSRHNVCALRQLRDLLSANVFWHAPC
jgi:hypothetical protein